MEDLLDLDVEIDLRTAETMKRALREAANAEGLKTYPEGDSLPEPLATLPRWHCGLPSVDVPYGGLQGVTILGGDAGVGKSTFSMACSLENALTGALVLYFDAENAAGEQRARAVRWFGGEAAFGAAQRQLALHWRWCLVDNRHSWQTLLLYAANEISHRHDRVLIVLDSLQTLAHEFEPRRNMLEVTGALYTSMNRLVRATDGRISFLVLSELNKEAGLKGGVAKYRGTMILRIDREDSLALGEHDYRLHMMKNRNGRLGGDLGLYQLEWSSCRFVKASIS